mmetsp:Transcript_30726/g.64462  ORF Transcript_30726/g.64462 Transcript_30726/m.64462 type:complete len:108 (-) Transcript_30726:3981-4304(-)
MDGPPEGGASAPPGIPSIDTRNDNGVDALCFSIGDRFDRDFGSINNTNANDWKIVLYRSTVVLPLRSTALHVEFSVPRRYKKDEDEWEISSFRRRRQFLLFDKHQQR